MKEKHHQWNSSLSFGLEYGKHMKKTPEMSWMEKVRTALRDKVQNVNEFTITENKVVWRDRRTGQLQV